MINNRQNGRRRGRGGQPPRNGQAGNPHSNSRVDNRQRGNASQLFEKYKTLARDAQMQGDRVNTEYYLQFADHYFRVLSESRSRFEEQRRPRDETGQDYGTEDDGGDGGQRGYAPRDFSDDGWDEAEAEREQEIAQQQAPQPQRAAPTQPQGTHAQGTHPQGNRRPPYPPRANGNGNGNNYGGNGNYAAPASETMPTASGDNGARATPEIAADEEAPARIAIELPPALGPVALDEPAPPAIAAEGDEQAPAPKRRRGRKPKVAEAPQPDA